MTGKRADSSWTDKVIRGQEAIVPGYGLGRVMDVVSEGGIGGAEYISVQFYAEDTYRYGAGGAHRRFVPEAVSLIDPTGLILTPYKAREAPKAHSARKNEVVPSKKSSPIQSRAWPSVGPRSRNGALA